MTCECEGKGFKELTTLDLQMLLKVMHKQNNAMAAGMRIAIRKELEERKTINT